MTLIQVPYNAPMFTALSTDIVDNKVVGLGHVGVKVYIIDTQKTYITGSALTLSEIPAGSSSSSLNDYICIKDIKATTVNGGTFTQGAWRTRDLNTEQSDVGGHASLNANQITLATGTYIVKIAAPAVRVNGHQALLYNVTGSAVLLYGSTAYAPDAHDTCTTSEIAGKIVLASPTTLEVQHQCFTTCATYGFGADPGFSTTNVYTVAEFWKVL